MDLRPKKLQQHGFSLLEAVCAVAILGTSMLAGLSLFQVQRTSQQVEEGYADALRLLKRDMEQLRAAEYAGIVTTKLEAVEDAPDFYLQRVVTQPESYAKEVRIEVQWRGLDDVKRSAALTTRRVEGIELNR